MWHGRLQYHSGEDKKTYWISGCISTLATSYHLPTSLLKFGLCCVGTLRESRMQMSGTGKNGPA